MQCTSTLIKAVTGNMDNTVLVSLMATIARDYAAYNKGSTDKSLDEIFNRYWVLDDYAISDTFANRLLSVELEVTCDFKAPAFWTAMRLRSIKSSVIICTDSVEPFDFVNIGSLQGEINNHFKTLCNVKEPDKDLEYKKEMYQPLTTLNRKEKFIIYGMGKVYGKFN